MELGCCQAMPHWHKNLCQIPTLPSLSLFLWLIPAQFGSLRNTTGTGMMAQHRKPCQ